MLCGRSSAAAVLRLIVQLWIRLSCSPLLPTQREGLEASAHLSLLAQLSEGLSAGQLLAFVQQVAARMRGDAGATAGAAGRPAEPVLAAGSATEQQEQKQQALAPLVQAALELLPGFPPVKPEDAQTLREWTARVHSPLPPEVRRLLGTFDGGRHADAWSSSLTGALVASVARSLLDQRRLAGAASINHHAMACARCAGGAQGGRQEGRQGQEEVTALHGSILGAMS